MRTNNDRYAGATPEVRKLIGLNEQRDRDMFENKVREKLPLMGSRVTAAFDDLWNDISNFIDEHPSANTAAILAELSKRTSEAAANCKDSLLYCVFGQEAEALGVDLQGFREVKPTQQAASSEARKSAANNVVKRNARKADTKNAL